MIIKICQIYLCSCFILSSSSANADEPILSFYEISGKNAGELRKQLDQKGPQDKTGRRFDALTRNEIAFSYRYAPTSGGCKFVGFSVKLETTITMPRWVNGDTTSRLGKQWQNYYQALYAHEMGHRDMGLRLFNEIETAGRKFETRKKCDTIAEQFNLLSSSIFEKYERFNQQYDLETDHGSRQGARFP